MSSLTPPQRHALRTICRLGSVEADAVRHAMKEPVRCIIAKGLARYTEQGIEPIDDGWAMGARMRPPILRPAKRLDLDGQPTSLSPEQEALLGMLREEGWTDAEIAARLRVEESFLPRPRR